MSESRDTLSPSGLMPSLLSARRGLGTSGIFVALAVIILFFQITTDGVLLTPDNLSRLLGQFGYILILAIGMVMVIIAGHIDLGVGSVVGFAGAISGVLIVREGMPIWVGVIITLLAGALIGAWNGYWVAYFGIPAFIVTLAGMLIFRGATQLALGSEQISPFPEGYRNIASGFLEGYAGYAAVPEFLGGGVSDLFTVLVGALAVAGFAVSQVRTRRARQKYRQPVASTGLFVLKLVTVGVVIMAFMFQLSKYSGTPVILIIVAVLALGFAVVTNRSVFGRHIYSIGGNLHAAELSGVKTKAVTFWVFVIMGVLSALAGIVFAARINLANPTNGNGFELDAIAAAFIGGAAVTGGVGRVVGAVVGGTIMAVLNNGMSIMGIDVSYQQVIKGAVLLAAVAFDVYNKRKVRV